MREKTKIKVIVETGKDLYSCFTPECPDGMTLIIGDGKTARKAVEDFKNCYQEELQWRKEHGLEELDPEPEFIFDIGAFFNYYFINVTAFAKYAGINPSLLRQYSRGLRTPTTATIAKVREAINKFRNDIDAGLLIDRPVPQYF